MPLLSITMRANGARWLLTWMRRHAVDEAGSLCSCREAGPSFSSSSDLGRQQLQARGVSSGKGRPALLPGGAPAAEPAGRPVAAQHQRGRPYSANPSQQRVERPWHKRDEGQHRHEEQRTAPQLRQNPGNSTGQQTNGELLAGRRSPSLSDLSSIAESM